MKVTFGAAALTLLLALTSSSINAQSVVTSADNPSPDPNAQARIFMAGAALDNSDLHLTIVSDSTCYSYGYTTYPKVAAHRWCLMFVVMLAEKLPAYTVKYRQWNYGSAPGPAGSSYDPWATIQVGSGTHTLWVSNASFPGASSYDFLGGRFQTAIVSTTPDLVIVSMGHNFTWNCPDCWPNLLLDLTESISLAFPNAGMILIGQNPTMAPYPYPTTTPQKVAVVQNVAQNRGYEFINIYQVFLGSGYPLADLLLSEGEHPTSPETQVGPENGSHLWASNVVQYFEDCFCDANVAQQPSTLGIPGKQLLTNGTFEDYPDGAAIPTAWLAEGGVAVSKDWSTFTNENGHSVHLSADNEPGWISRSLDISAVAGQCVTLAAREYIAAGMPATTGQLSVIDNVSPPDTNTVVGLQSGDWRWLSVTHCFPANIDSASVSIYADSARTSGALSIDKACLTTGHNPNSCQMGLTVTATNATRPFGTPNPLFTGTIAGLKDGDNISATYSSVANSTSTSGTYAIVPTLIDPDAKLGNYTVTSYNGVLTVLRITPTLATPSSLSISTTQNLVVVIAVSGETGNPTPTGTVTLSSGTYSSQPTTLTRGSASINVQAGSLRAGIDTLLATYTPDAASSSLYNNGFGSTLVTVTHALATVAVTPSLSSITTAQPLAMTVAVAGTPTPTGSVTLSGGSYTSSATALSGGSATISIPAGSLAAGSDTLTASYSGDSNYNAATGASTITVTVPPPTVVNKSTNSTGIVAWGDSLTAGGEGVIQTGNYPAMLGSSEGIPVVNEGVGGTTSTQIGVREGAIPTYVQSVSGDTIPACTSLPCTGVIVTFLPGYEPYAPYDIDPTGTILGVQGRITIKTAATIASAVYTFTPSQPTPAVSVVGTPQFVLDRPYANYIPIFWEGYNNLFKTLEGPWGPAQIESDIAAQVATVPVGQKFLVLSIINHNNSRSAQKGGSDYDTMISTNAVLATTYGANYLDIRSILVSSYNPLLPTDVTDYANDEPPTSFRAISGVGTLAENIGENDTTFTVTMTLGTLTQAPLEPRVLTIDNENIKVLSASGSTVTSCIRNWGGTLASHSSGAIVTQDDALHFNSAGAKVVADAVASKLSTLGIGSVRAKVTVTPASTSLLVNAALSVTITVASASGSGATTTGTVTLSAGGYISASTTLNGGSATISIPAGSLAAGSDTLTASYSGDSNYNAATGASTITVTAPPPPSFTVSGTAVTVSRGATSGNTSTFTVIPAGGFTGSVVLTAAIASSPTGAQYPPSLSFGSTSPVSIAGTTAGAATLTITTTAPSSASLVLPKRLGIPWYASGGATLACLLLLGLPARRRSWRTLLGTLAFLVVLTGGLLACGGSGGGGGGGGTSNPGTTAGTYTVAVTGTSGTVATTGTITVNVQ